MSTVGALTGTAGVGKTAVAVHVAHALAGDFADGQLYIELRGFDASPALSPHDVLGRFLAALGILPDRVPEGLDERAALYRSALAERRVLVVLDNARDSGQVRRPISPSCRVWAFVRGAMTSRRTSSTWPGAASVAFAQPSSLKIARV